jgi:hypothetical protein
MPWNWEYEVEVEVEEPDYEIEIEYDDGYHPEYEIEVDYDGGHGYHQQPQYEVEIEFDTTSYKSWGAKNQQTMQSWCVPWSGHFMQNGQKTNMHFQNFQIDLNGNIWGHGSDNVGNFNISGRMNNNGSFKFVKQYYGQHAVTYQGRCQGAYLSGQWVIPGNCQGTFQIKLNAQRWSGCFWQNGQRNNMFLDMSVSNYGVSGQGSDNVGAFTVRGQCQGGSVSFAKHYWGQHTVFYNGHWQGNNIKGNWQIPNNCDGKFQLHMG